MHPATVVALDIGGSSVKSGRLVDRAPDGGVIVTPVVRDAPAAAIIDAFAARYAVTVETVSGATESMFFPLPRQLRELDKASGTAAE